MSQIGLKWDDIAWKMLFLQNVYYTLLSRANSEMCVYFMDGETQDYF